jgi:hypothetical protein
MSLLEQLKDPTSAAVFVATVAITLAVYYFLMGGSGKPRMPEPKEVPPPRNFTPEQLRVNPP